MKACNAIALLLLSANVAVAKNDDIDKVVGKLEDMLGKSKKDGEDDDKLWEDFKNYCDDNTKEKTESIAKLKGKILELKAEIKQRLGRNGVLSVQCSTLKTSITSLKDALEEAKTLRDKQHVDYVDVKEDTKAAIKQCEEAIEVLAEVGADQTDGSFTQIKETVRSALAFASAALPKRQQRTVESFIQAPFTGTYSAQSGEVVGILKNMLDTFKMNLLSARGSEKTSVTGYEGLCKLKNSGLELMENTFEEKQKEMGANDESLALKQDQLAEAEKSLEDDEDFMEKLLPMCKLKGQQYKSRTMLRKAEQEAIEQALKILTSDSADAAFGSKLLQQPMGATTLLQIGSARRAAAATVDAPRRATILALLRKAAGSRNSFRLAQVAMALESGNPFTVILDKIDNIIKAIAKEGEADEKEKEFCSSERSDKKDDLKKLKKSVRQAKEQITEITNDIEDERTGLLAQIDDTEEKGHDMHENMAKETESRAEENKEYQESIKHSSDGQNVVEQAIKVLKLHYEKEAAKKAASEEESGDEPAFVQVVKEDPPKTKGWDKDFEGQSEAGNKVIGMLEKVLQDIVDVEMEDHGDEHKSQEEYEDSMKELTESYKKNEEAIAELKLDLSDKEKELVEKKAEKKATEEAIDGIEKYLEHIKPSCDFIDENFEKREKARKDEKEALEKAIKLLKGSPGYTIAKAKAEEDSWGKCKDTCKEEGKEHAECQACLADISVPGYCAGHSSAPGC